MADIISPLKAIRANCLECANSANEVKLCPCTNCPLYAFRLGKNPHRKKRVLTDEQIASRVENLRRAREARAAG